MAPSDHELSRFPEPQPRARRAALTAVAVVFAVAVLLALSGRLALLGRLGFPPMSPPFADLRVLTGAAESLREGFDPMRVNPGDPWGRALNYPRIWLVAARLGIDSSSTVWLAGCLWTVAALGMAWLAGLVRRRRAALAFTLACASPITWFALERANTDLLMFGLLAAATACVARSPARSTALIGLASVLKLFPIFALAALLGIERRRAWRKVIALCGCFGVYLFAIRDDLARIALNTQHWPPISYGVAIAPQWGAPRLGVAQGWLAAGAYALLAGVALAAALARRRMRIVAPDAPASLAALRVGAAVYAGSFLLGSNFDYRLLFLLFTVPCLGDWSAAEHPLLRRAARVGVSVVLLVLWSSLWRQGLALLPAGEAVGRGLDELLTWACWALLVFALALSLPARALPPEVDVDARSTGSADRAAAFEPQAALPAPRGAARSRSTVLEVSRTR